MWCYYGATDFFFLSSLLARCRHHCGRYGQACLFNLYGGGEWQSIASRICDGIWLIAHKTNRLVASHVHLVFAKQMRWLVNGQKRCTTKTTTQEKGRETRFCTPNEGNTPFAVAFCLFASCFRKMSDITENASSMRILSLFSRPFFHRSFHWPLFNCNELMHELNRTWLNRALNPTSLWVT